MRMRVLPALLAVALFAGVQATTAAPVRNVSARRHPNLAAAQKLCQQAYQKIVAAQNANEWDMAGHAQNAKNLLDQVNSELKAAALEANEHR